MKKLLKRLSLVALVVLAAIQLHRPERTNPPVDPSATLAAHLSMPPAAAEIFDRACRDCHSHETRWPWYSHVAPASWFVIGHVDHARSHLNVSQWSRYETKKADHHLEEMCEHAEDRRMPLPSYTWLHPRARLTGEEIRILCDWTRAARTELAAAKPAE